MFDKSKRAKYSSECCRRKLAVFFEIWKKPSGVYVAFTRSSLMATYIARCPANENRASMIKPVAETKKIEKEEFKWLGVTTVTHARNQLITGYCFCQQLLGLNLLKLNPGKAKQPQKQQQQHGEKRKKETESDSAWIEIKVKKERIRSQVSVANPSVKKDLYAAAMAGCSDHEHSPCHPNLQATIQESDEDRARKCCNMGLGVEQSTRVRVAESSRNRC
ncbi:hypothetical protein NC652_029612 [Populus alba x Populus x berolinensis]|nr:hypothetical protein NC652_029612 [Populus alba x Populus x berolinensis]